MENNQKIRNIIQALGEHKDSQAAIEILTELMSILVSKGTY